MRGQRILANVVDEPWVAPLEVCVSRPTSLVGTFGDGLMDTSPELVDGDR